MINFVKRRRLYYLFSAIIIVAGLVAMFLSTRTYPDRSIVRLSVDFLGGSISKWTSRRLKGRRPRTLMAWSLTKVLKLPA